VSGGEACRFHVNDKTSVHHVVTARRRNYSAFNGYHCTPSEYSEVRCLVTGARWRTKAAYVDQLRDMGHDAAVAEINRRIDEHRRNSGEVWGTA
jgi:hypothetical protein